MIVFNKEACVSLDNSKDDTPKLDKRYVDDISEWPPVMSQ